MKKLPFTTLPTIDLGLLTWTLPVAHHLASRVPPAVIIPTYSERESNARWVAAAGAGTFVLPMEHSRARKHIQVEELRATVLQVLEDPAYTLAAKGISQKLQVYGGAQQAARLIEGLARTVGKAPQPARGQADLAG
jgi:UDP:flavonoid glycosyltransferase YjiC (YdhE family)